MTADASPESGATDAPVVPTPTLAIVPGHLGRVMIIAGIITFMFVGFQLWGTDIQESRAQDNLRSDLSERFDAAADLLDDLLAQPDPDPDPEPEPEPETESDVTPLPEPAPTLPGGHDPDVLALLFPEDGDALARIEIPAIDVDKVVVRGVAVEDLRRGPGHYSQTPLAGNTGNTAIAGHRTTYGSPFNRIDELIPGDDITITSVQGEFTYRVMDPVVAYADHLDQVHSIGEGHIIVRPSDTWVLYDFGDDRLTLTACHPKLSSRQRIIVTAELVTEVAALPDWVLEAQAERDSGVSTVADAPGLGADETTVEESTPDTTAEIDADEQPPAADLDEGLNGERGAITGAAIWMIAALGFWYAGGRLGRQRARHRTGRLALRGAGLLPALICLWFSFEMIDRALPAG